MFSVKQAKTIVEKNLPGGTIKDVIVYEDVYLFKVFNDDPLEGDMDPFFSVNISTGEFRDFSIITDGDIGEITKLFARDKKRIE